MSSSFINIEGKEAGFWVKDNVMRLVCIFLIQNIENLQKDSWPDEFIELLNRNAEGVFPGWMHLDLHKYLDKMERREKFLKLIDETKSMLTNKGHEISEEEINSYCTNEYLQNKWQGPVETSLFIRTLDFLKALVQGKITTTSSDSIDYW